MVPLLHDFVSALVLTCASDERTIMGNQTRGQGRRSDPVNPCDIFHNHHKSSDMIQEKHERSRGLVRLYGLVNHPPKNIYPQLMVTCDPAISSRRAMMRLATVLLIQICHGCSYFEVNTSLGTKVMGHTMEFGASETVFQGEPRGPSNDGDYMLLNVIHKHKHK